MNAVAATAALPCRPATISSTRPGATGMPGIPADAADWLRAHFDWTRGAVWVACERWRVDAATVVAWAERLRAGGARAGLGARERTWIVAQLSDPEQRPTRVESAMARTWARGLEATPPLAIRSVHDAIALLEARTADSERDGDAADRTDPFRALLLDDLRALRDGRRDEPEPVRDEQRDETPEQKVSETTMATHATVYSTREAVCPQCGKTFVARKYSTGWTTYCSQSCGARGHRAAQQATGQTTGAFPGVGLSQWSDTTHSTQSAQAAETTAEPTAAPLATQTPEPQPAPVVDPDETLIERKRAWAETQPTPAPEPTPEPAPTRTPLIFAAPSGAVTVAAAPAVTVTVGGPSPLLSALLERLPATGGRWSARERERWLRAFTATLDLEVTTTEEGN